MSKEKIYKAIEEALELSKGTINGESSSLNTEGWDSIGHISILVAIDNLFDGKVASIKEMATADSVEKITTILRKHSLI